jgi:EmrB/QacA subfamily drug resistance transporter
MIIHPSPGRPAAWLPSGHTVWGSMRPREDLFVSDPTTGASKWAVFALISVGTFMTTLDSSIVNISLPAIARSFHTPLGGTVEWVLIAYLVVIAACLLTFGRLADLVGRERVWIAGVGLFTVGSLLCGIAPSLPLLVAARAVQGVGGALIFAPAIALVVDAFPRSERGRALGMNTVIVSLGISTGPTLGGLITEHLSWRWIFFVNLPLGVAGVLLARRLLPLRPPQGHGRFDPPGALAFGVGLAALCLGLSFGREWGWSSARSLTALVIAAAGLAGAVVVELRRRDPLLDIRLVGSRVLGSALLSFLLSILALFAVAFLLPFYFEQLRGFGPLRSGLLLTPYSLALAMVAPLSGTLADKVGSRWLAPLGLSLACTGLLLLAQLGPDASPFEIAWRLAISGVGQGLFQSPNTRTVMGAAPPDQSGTVSGLVATTRVVAQSLSVAIAGAVFTGLGGAAAGAALMARRAAGGGAGAAAETAALQAQFLHAFHAAIVVCGALAALGVLTALVRGSDAGPDRGAP